MKIYFKKEKENVAIKGKLSVSIPAEVPQKSRRSPAEVPQKSRRNIIYSCKHIKKKEK